MIFQITFLNLMNFKHKIKVLFILVLFLSNCAKIDPVTGEKILIETDPKEKAKKAVEQGGGIFGNIAKGGTGGQITPSFANSNVLWKAALKSLEFLPLANTDYTGGIIIYDWYSHENNSQEQIKISVRFLSDELRSDSILIIAHKRNCENINKCSNVKVEQKFMDTIKENIINLARSLKIEESKKIKN
jgi:hypothetical protein